MAIKRDKKRVITPRLKKTEEKIDRSLRPKKLIHFPGQLKVKENLQILIEAAKKRKEPLDHILFYGPPGLGKTTLAYVISREIGHNIKVTSGPALERAGDLASILTNLQENDILFIDEIHRLNKIVEEILYSAMEDFALDIIIGKGPSAKTLRLDLAHFTLIGTTIQIGSIAAPMRERFGSIHKLDFYKIKDIKKMVTRSAKILNVDIDNDAAWEIARSARRTPRVANRLLKRIRDFAQVKTDGKITLITVKKALEMLDIDNLGLDLADRSLLKTIIQKFNGGPVGLDNIAACIGEDRGNIEEVYEPYLMRLGFLKRTPRGRVAQPKAYEYLDIPYAGDDGTQKVKITQIDKNQEKLL